MMALDGNIVEHRFLKGTLSQAASCSLPRSAAEIYSEDAGNYFTSTNVMGQLQELGEKIKELSAKIPTKTSQLENDSGFVNNKDAIETETVKIPSKLSELENDVGYLTLDTLPQT